MKAAGFNNVSFTELTGFIQENVSIDICFM